jgi:hypothetical protein
MHVSKTVLKSFTVSTAVHCLGNSSGSVPVRCNTKRKGGKVRFRVVKMRLLSYCTYLMVTMTGHKWPIAFLNGEKYFCIVRNGTDIRYQQHTNSIFWPCDRGTFIWTPSILSIIHLHKLREFYLHGVHPVVYYNK